MRRVRYRDFHQLATYCKSEGLDIDNIVKNKKVMTNRNNWTKEILR